MTIDKKEDSMDLNEEKEKRLKIEQESILKKLGNVAGAAKSIVELTWARTTGQLPDTINAYDYKQKKVLATGKRSDLKLSMLIEKDRYCIKLDFGSKTFVTKAIGPTDCIYITNKSMPYLTLVTTNKTALDLKTMHNPTFQQGNNIVITFGDKLEKVETRDYKNKSKKKNDKRSDNMWDYGQEFSEKRNFNENEDISNIGQTLDKIIKLTYQGDFKILELNKDMCEKIKYRGYDDSIRILSKEKLQTATIKKMALMNIESSNKIKFVAAVETKSGRVNLEFTPKVKKVTVNSESDFNLYSLLGNGFDNYPRDTKTNKPYLCVLAETDSMKDFSFIKRGNKMNKELRNFAKVLNQLRKTLENFNDVDKYDLPFEAYTNGLEGTKVAMYIIDLRSKQQVAKVYKDGSWDHGKDWDDYLEKVPAGYSKAGHSEKAVEATVEKFINYMKKVGPENFKEKNSIPDCNLHPIAANAADVVVQEDGSKESKNIGEIKFSKALKDLTNILNKM